MQSQDYVSIYAEGIIYDELKKIGPTDRSFHLWRISRDLILKGIDKEGVILFLQENGYYRSLGINKIAKYSHISNGIIKDTNKAAISDYLYKFVKSISEALRVYRSNKNEEFKDIEPGEFLQTFHINAHNVINDTALGFLEINKKPILRDTKDKVYLIFNNKILEITKHGIEHRNYDEFGDVLISDAQIIDNHFQFDEKWKTSPFAKFIDNITSGDKNRKNSIASAIGYLLHNYNDIANSQAVILYDEEPTDLNTPMGGSGKGLLGQALEAVNKGFVRMDGKGIKLDSQFLFQRIEESTSIIFLDDISQKFSFERLNSVLSDGFEIERKFEAPIRVSKIDMPKFVIASNIIMPYEGTTISRRQHIIEFSNYYSTLQKQGISQPIIHEHKTRFFSDEWSAEDWNGFYTFMANCLKYYLKKGLVKPPKLNMKKNRAIQKMGFPLYNSFKAMEFNHEIEYSLVDIYNQLIGDGVIDEESDKRTVTEHLKRYLSSEEKTYSIKKQKITVYGI